MGNTNVVSLNADTPSPMEPDKLSVVSDPLHDNICMEDIWHSIKEYFLYPLGPLYDVVLKSCDVTKHYDGDNDFSCRVVLDGKKLDSYGYGKGDGSDRLFTNCRTSLNWEKKEIKTVNYKAQCWVGEEAGDETIVSIAMTRFFKSEPPLQYEFYIDLPQENPPRRDSSDLSLNISKGVLDPIVKQVAQTKARVIQDADSISGVGKVVTTPELDEHTTYGAFFSSLLYVLKEVAKQHGAPEVIDTSDKQFKAEMKDHVGNTTIITTDYDEETGEVQSTTVTNGRVLRKTFYTVHKDPLRMESWLIDEDGARNTGRTVAVMVQMQLNAILEKATSWF